MSTITVVKGLELYKNAVISILTKTLAEHSFYVFNEDDCEKMFQQNYPTDLVFIDAAAEINLKRTIKYYKSINARITLLVPQIDEEQILQLLKFDLDGYFCERMDVKEIAAAMKMVLKGHRYIHPYLASILYKDYLRITNRKVVRPRGLLTKREWQILLEMAKGNTNDEIAQNLMISDKTVKNHVTAILRKLAVKDRTNAVLKAIKRGWVAF